MHKILLLILLPFTLQAQSLKIGLKAAAPLSASLHTTRLDYYFADDRNSWYTVHPNKRLEQRFIVFPRLFAQYMLTDNLFLGYEAGYTTFLKKFTIRASNDFKNDLILDTHYDFSFFSNSLYAGYKFLRTREVRPKLYSGLSYIRLLRLAEVSNRSLEYFLKNIDPYGKIIHHQITGLSRSLLAHSFGVGIEYYILTLDVAYEYSIHSLNKAPSTQLYTHYRMFSFSAGINLLGILPGGGKVKNFRNHDE